jgi:hypothetical protein
MVASFADFARIADYDVCSECAGLGHEVVTTTRGKYGSAVQFSLPAVIYLVLTFLVV